MSRKDLLSTDTRQKGPKSILFRPTSRGLYHTNGIYIWPLSLRTKWYGRWGIRRISMVLCYIVTSLLGNVVCIDGCSDTRSLIHHTYYIMESDEAKIVAVMSASAVFNMRFTNERPRWKDWKDLITYIISYI